MVAVSAGDMTFRLTDKTLTIVWMDCAAATMSRDDWLKVVGVFAAIYMPEIIERHKPKGESNGDSDSE